MGVGRESRFVANLVVVILGVVVAYRPLEMEKRDMVVPGWRLNGKCGARWSNRGAALDGPTNTGTVLRAREHVVHQSIPLAPTKAHVFMTIWKILGFPGVSFRYTGGPRGSTIGSRHGAKLGGLIKG